MSFLKSFPPPTSEDWLRLQQPDTEAPARSTSPRASCLDEEDGDEDVEPITEFRFVPSDKSTLESMFTAMCECQALHPDPEDEDSDDYDGEGYDVEAHEQGQGDSPTFYT
ncbi:hypothetical protein U0070_017354 [Myodes glareolus]|uniref:Methylosome subunit pICln n=1 Tax=Myodes glareolus TaxID=447135 RepID=A0AAW0K396_MYOGA